MAADRQTVGMATAHGPRGRALPMIRVDAVLPSPLQDRMARHEPPAIEDADRVGQLMHLDDAPGPVGNAVIVAADRDEAIVADATLQLEQGVEGQSRQGLQLRPVGGEGFRDDPLRGAVQADVGDGVEPAPKLAVEVVEVAEGTCQEEVLADVGERSLDLPLGLGPVRAAGARQEAVVLGERHQGSVVDDVAVCILAGDRRLHAIVEDLDRHAADRGKGLHVTAQQRLQILVQDEACLDVPGMAEHQREQPDDAGRARRIREGDDEAGEVDLRLLAGRGLEADLVGLGLGRPDRGGEPLHRGVGTGIAVLAQLAGQAHGAQVGEGGDPLAQVIEVGRELARSAGLTRAVGRRFEAALDVLTDRLRIAAGPAGDGVTDRPCRCRSRIMTSSPSRTILVAPSRSVSAGMVAEDGKAREGAERRGPTGQGTDQGISMPTIREYSTPADSGDPGGLHPRHLDPLGR